MELSWPSLAERQQVNPIKRITRIFARPSQRQHRSGPIHGDDGLIGSAAGGHFPRPARDGRHPDAPFVQGHLAFARRPVVGVAIASVITGEHDERVSTLARVLQRSEHAADALVHTPDHGGKDLE
jgi:hypothetical protein